MTNMQCYSYAVIALDELLKGKNQITPDSLYDKLYYIWDMYTEEEIERLAKAKEDNGELLQSKIQYPR